jgi:hypothetical protein
MATFIYPEPLARVWYHYRDDGGYMFLRHVLSHIGHYHLRTLFGQDEADRLWETGIIPGSFYRNVVSLVMACSAAQQLSLVKYCNELLLSDDKRSENTESALKSIYWQVEPSERFWNQVKAIGAADIKMRTDENYRKQLIASLVNDSSTQQHLERKFIEESGCFLLLWLNGLWPPYLAFALERIFAEDTSESV